MKRLSMIVALMAILGITSCRKDRADGPGEIYGTWKLTEVWMDPGDGSGDYEPVKGKNQVITIQKNGIMDGKGALPGVISYKILDNSRIEVLLQGYGQPTIYQYKVSARSLTINPPCIEGCGYRFVRVE